MSGGSGRLVITGAGGQLGSRLAAQAADRGRDVLALNSSQWDITDPAAVYASSPTVTGATSVVSTLVLTRAPIVVRCLRVPS